MNCRKLDADGENESSRSRPVFWLQIRGSRGVKLLISARRINNSEPAGVCIKIVPLCEIYYRRAFYLDECAGKKLRYLSKEVLIWGVSVYIYLRLSYYVQREAKWSERGCCSGRPKNVLRETYAVILFDGKDGGDYEVVSHVTSMDCEVDLEGLQIYRWLAREWFLVSKCGPQALTAKTPRDGNIPAVDQIWFVTHTYTCACKTMNSLLVKASSYLRGTGGWRIDKNAGKYVDKKHHK